MEETNPQNNYKRKRKKSFLKNARKYGKKGCFGRGSQLDSDTYQYFIRILEAYKEGFPSDDEKLLFVNNVFEQIDNQEVNYSCNQLGCRVIEMLLPFANDEILIKFLAAFNIDIRPLCSDRFASHVIQKLFQIATEKQTCSDTKPEVKESCRDFILKISKFLLNNLEDYVWDVYGNHIIRTVLESLASTEMPEEYQEIVKDYAVRLISWPQFDDFPYSEITSGLLQVLLKTLCKADSKRFKMYVKKLINDNLSKESDSSAYGFESSSEKLPQVFWSKPAVMLLETILEIAPPKRFSKVYEKCFKDKIVSLALQRSANFSVQKLFNNCSNKTEFEAMFDEICDHFKQILDKGHSGVVLSVAQACKRLSARQGGFYQSLVKTLNCFEPASRQNSAIPCVSKLQTYEEQENQKLSLHGILIINTMLEFNKPIKIINSILNMETNDLLTLFSDSMGSHIVDSYTKSQYVGEKSREKLIRKMQGTYQDLAADKYGSRSFEAIWNVSSLKLKMAIMDELSHKDAAWSNSKFGKIISGKTNFPLYKRNREDWKNSHNKLSKTQELFADILK